MSNNREGNLPAPHEVVTISVKQGSEMRFHVEYEGTPAQLVAAGIVDDRMQGKILNQRSGVMLDRNRHAFKIIGARGANKRAAWEGAERCVVRYYGLGPGAVLELPGVAALFPAGLVDDQRSELNATIERLGAVAHVMRQIEDGGNKPRCRIVGRKRREATWYALGDVLFVNWTDIARDRVLARV